MSNNYSLNYFLCQIFSGLLQNGRESGITVELCGWIDGRDTIIARDTELWLIGRVGLTLIAIARFL
jgi:hypothetical protein